MPRPSTPILSRHAIVEVAFRLVDAEGASALTMRRLAKELGVSGPSLYHHFESKDAIVDGIVELIENEIRLEALAPDWEAVLAEYAYQLRAVLSAHPYAVEFFALAPVTSPAGLRIYDHLATQLAASGWDPDLAQEAVLAIEDLAFGAALMANAPDIQLTPRQREQYPLLARVFEDLPGRPVPDGFEIGFRALIDALRQVQKSPSTLRSANGRSRAHP